MHPLRTWCRAQGWTQKQLAAALKCTPSAVSQLLSGLLRPSPEMADRVSELTGGAVTARVEAVWRGPDGEWRG